MANLEGHILLGRYEIIESVGRGGMADVYRALDRKRNQEVAIKVLREDLAEDPVLRQRFRDEAHVLSKLTHKNIVRLYEFEEEGDHAFLVMDFIEGTTLNKHLKNHRLSLGQALWILEQVCPALNYAHEEKYVHRDIKPSNIMIQSNGTVLLSDFGIARVIEEGATGSTSLIGTAGYMSPEQCLGKFLDQTTDIYSLGIVAYEMVAGRRPFIGDTDQTSGGTFERVRWQQIHQLASPPSTINRDLPAETDGAILGALAKNPARRPRTAMEFLSEFKAGCLATRVSAEMVAIDEPPPPPPPPVWKPGERPRKSQWRVLTPLMVLPLVLVSVVGLVALLRAIPVSSTSNPTQVAQNTQTVGSPTTVPMETPKPALVPPLTATPSPTDSPVPSPRPTTPVPTPTVLPTNTLAPTPTKPPTNTPVPAPIPLTPTPSGPEGMVLIPAGTFWMGAAEGDSAAQADEKPGMFLDIPVYWIDKFEVSVGQYKKCVDAGKCDRPSDLWSPQNLKALFGNPNLAAVQDYPIAFVSHGNASQYCVWAGKRLPFEYEWEKAARGTYDARIWPWGSTWDGYKANAAQGKPGPLIVTQYSNPADAQSYGCGVLGVCNMSGNVREWVADYYQAGWYKDGYRDVQPGTVGKGKPNWNYSTQMVIRGGSYRSDQASARVSKRFSGKPADTMDDVGFRCAMDAK